MKALILAAGYAMRLYPLTKERAKSLLLVNNKPIINYIVEKLENIDEIDEIIVITNSKFFVQFKDWAKNLKCKKNIRLVDDLTKNNNDRLGAIGDINFAIKQENINDDLLVIGGDNLFETDLKDFLTFTKNNPAHPSIGVFSLKEKEHAKKYGVIKLDEKNIVVDFQEKPDKPQSCLVAMCLYLFPKAKLGLVKEYLDTNKDKYDVMGHYIEWLIRKEPIYGFVFKGRWYDIGDHSFYKEAKERFDKQ